MCRPYIPFRSASITRTTPGQRLVPSRNHRSPAEVGSDTPAHWSVTFAVDDAEATAARARELGGEVVAGPFDAPWTRMAVIKDPQGATFIASQFVPENKDLEA